MSEKRTSIRRRVLKVGMIAVGNGDRLEGVIKNLSPTGALLHVKNSISFPDEFTLVIVSDDFRRSCRVAWRQPNKIGVEFV